MIGFYRKKPVTIEAVRFGRHNGVKIAEWCGGLLATERTPNGSIFISIPTLEGTMQAALGDWIIKGINGEFYPCKPDIFEKTYERAA
jgi:hypothetical protein